jgi:peptidoglycan/xylan/chitin deacetylase (PgdA/CDA1 family)
MRLLFIVLFVSAAAFGQAKKICVTIDDLPVVNYGNNDTCFQRSIINGILDGLTGNHIHAIGFVNEGRLYASNRLDPFRASLLQQWVAAGQDLGNHTFSHPDFNTTACDEFFADVIKGENVTRSLLEKAGRKLRYFRHPFLHAGISKTKADSLGSFLAGRGYVVAPVTVDNDDYLFALAYQRAQFKKDSLLAATIGKDYITYMRKKVLYFEHHAKALFGRDINQILLIHASLINADYIDSLAAMCRGLGYRFVDINEALKDDAYSTPVTAFGKWGISWLDRWALSQGKPSSFFRDEPDVPAYITTLSQ